MKLDEICIHDGQPASAHICVRTRTGRWINSDHPDFLKCSECGCGPIDTELSMDMGGLGMGMHSVPTKTLVQFCSQDCKDRYLDTLEVF